MRGGLESNSSSFSREIIREKKWVCNLTLHGMTTYMEMPKLATHSALFSKSFEEDYVEIGWTFMAQDSGLKLQVITFLSF